MICILDCGIGNTASVLNMLRKVGGDAVLTHKEEIIRAASKIILPGVGAFDQAIDRLGDLNLIQLLRQKALIEKVPFLGICLGMQLMSHVSEEGTKAGLGLIDAEAVRFRFRGEMTGMNVPHMGWNTIKTHKGSTLFRGLCGETRFYFAHSYHMLCNDRADILATTHYGIDFVSAIEHSNLFGTQFHPEKSHKFGMKVLKNFVEFS